MNDKTHTNAPIKRTVSAHFISAPWRSSGKTLISIGLARAAVNRGLEVQPYKKGPDYIDPLWLAAATGRPCFNLDSYQQSFAELTDTYHRQLPRSGVALVEGTMGLHDGLAEDGSDSNAAIAQRLALPVVLVVDCRGMHRTVAALLNGLQSFNSELEISGVILNRLRGARHESKIVSAIEQHTNLGVIGAIQEDPSVVISEQELGLLPTIEHADQDSIINRAASLLEGNCDIDQLLVNSSADSKNHLAQHAAGQNSANQSTTTGYTNPREIVSWSTQQPERYVNLKIGVAQDSAFCFYYQDDIDRLCQHGVEIVPVSPIRDRFPDNLDGLILGGGFPERHASLLSANSAFRASLASAITNGLVVHAECGGLMYLCKSIETGNVVWPMVGIFDGKVKLCDRPQGRGYVRLKPLDAAIESTYRKQNDDSGIHAHEFHHSKITFDSEPDFVYRVERGYGIDGKNDGASVHNVVASYAHFRHTEANPWIDRFLERIMSGRVTSNPAANNV